MSAKRDAADMESGGGNLSGEKQSKGGPLMGTIWFCLMFIIPGIIFGLADYDLLAVFLGWRSLIAFAGYLVMQIGLWHAEHKWDEEGSAAYLASADKDNIGYAAMTPEDLEEMQDMMEGKISEEDLKSSFPVPWGFLIGWWLWGISYLFPMDGTIDNFEPTVWGIIACVVSFAVSFIASIPMANAVQNRNADMKKKLSGGFLAGWIMLGVMSALDVSKNLDDNFTDESKVGQWFLCMLGPITIIISQKILFESRKMGTLWEQSGKPNFHPIVYNMGGPLFVLGWFILWIGTQGVPMAYFQKLENGSLVPDLFYDIEDKIYLPLFLNWRTFLAFTGGCAMIPVVRLLDYSHDEDGPWLGENNEGKVFSKWWVGTDGSFFGVFLESPWPFIMAWSVFGFSSFLGYDDKFDVSWREILLLVNCVLQAFDAGVLIQQSLYAGDAAGKQRYSLPFVFLFVCLAVNIGSAWCWYNLLLSFPGAILIIAGQKTVFGARKRGDYTLQNDGRANPYESVFVYSYGEVFFMMGWLLISWGMSMPNQP